MVYGYNTSEKLERARRGEVVLEGCEIGEPPEPWCWDDCEAEEPRDDLDERSRAEERDADEDEGG